MPATPDQTRYLYVSQAAPALPMIEVGRILAVSRQRNRVAGVRGALLFDGESFAQLLEGPTGNVAEIRGRIEADRRHHRLRTLVDAPADGPTPWAEGWVAGFAPPGILQVIHHPDHALRRLGRLMPLCDVA